MFPRASVCCMSVMIHGFCVVLLVDQNSLWQLVMNSHTSLYILTNVLTLLNHVYHSDTVNKCQVHKFNSAWERLQTVISEHKQSSLLSSLAVHTSAIVLRHAPQSDISRSVHCCSLMMFSGMFVILTCVNPYVTKRHIFVKKSNQKIIYVSFVIPFC